MNTAKIMSRSKSLAYLLEGEPGVPDVPDVQLTGIEIDSRRIEKGDLFIACKGANHDGRKFVDDVIARGASAVLVEEGDQWREVIWSGGVPVIPVTNLACRIGKFAARFFDYPAADLCLIGITGTNGKTSCCRFIAQYFTALGRTCGVSGTIGHGIYGETDNTASDGRDGPATTPDPVEVQRILAEVRAANADTMAMEVSSHGLRQNRVCVHDFDMAVFTNLSRDHLDYHGSMKAYGNEKLKLFNGSSLKAAVVNIDDPFSSMILNNLARNVKSYTYSLANSDADVHAQFVEFGPGGVQLEVITPWGQGSIDSPLLGSFNVSNLLAVVTTVLARESLDPGFDFQSVLDKAAAIAPIRGRMEIISEHPIFIVVDYAHTPDGLENALLAMREHYTGTVWCVFGCGGERDKGKRPLMAEVAERLADRIVITDDNPRNEPSAEIIEQILAGIRERTNVVVESNRANAIDHAISAARDGDVILIAGKGHEEYQDVGGSRTIFSDVRQARISLQKRMSDLH